MRHTLFRAAAAALTLTVLATTADAKCTRLGFSVNDYGKDLSLIHISEPTRPY